MNEKLEKILSGFTDIAPPYSNETKIKSDLGISSLSLVELIVDLEKAFDIEFDLDELDTKHLTTVGYLSMMVENHAK